MAAQAECGHKVTGQVGSRDRPERLKRKTQAALPLLAWWPARIVSIISTTLSCWCRGSLETVSLRCVNWQQVANAGIEGALFGGVFQAAFALIGGIVAELGELAQPLLPVVEIEEAAVLAEGTGYMTENGFVSEANIIGITGKIGEAELANLGGSRRRPFQRPWGIA